MPRLSPELVRRLAEVGLGQEATRDPSGAWRRLHERFGTRATLIDRYELEAAARGLDPDDLPAQERQRLALDVLRARSSELEFLAGSGRPVADPIEVVAYDERWPSLFVEWRERLSRALGATAVSIDHIGSTSVPGLAAKPVIDIQVAVRDLDDESKYVPAIEDLGVALRARERGHRYFRPSGSLPRTVQIHVYEAGSDEERVHLLFRDHLRADPRARERYARMKRDAARRFRGDRIAYNEAKTAFILDEIEIARARATGRTMSSDGTTSP